MKFKRIRKGFYESVDGSMIIEQPGPNWSWRLYYSDDDSKTPIAVSRYLSSLKIVANDVDNVDDNKVCN